MVRVVTLNNVIVGEELKVGRLRKRWTTPLSSVGLNKFFLDLGFEPPATADLVPDVAAPPPNCVANGGWEVSTV